VNTSISLGEKIERVIAQRSRAVRLLEPLAQAVEENTSRLTKFQTFLQQCRSRIEPELASRATTLAAHAETLLGELTQEKARLLLLKARFERPTLNIGVAGLAGQGKSTLLQRLTGLSETVVPSGSGDHCTGAACAITNGETKPRATVHFHTEASFLEQVILPFYEQLGEAGRPGSVEDFARRPLPTLPVETTPGFDTIKQYHRKLAEFRDALIEIRPLLGQKIPPVDEENIRNYVAQQDLSGRKINAWRAVRKVEVSCRFPNHDLGRVCLLDTPGLGDFISSAEQRLVRTLGENLDLVLFVRMPNEMGRDPDERDTNLYNLIRRAIPDLDPAAWSFYLLNDNGKNRGQFDRFARELNERELHTAEVLRLCGADSAQACAALERVVAYLAEHIGRLDGDYARRRLVPLKELQTRVIAFANEAEAALPVVASGLPAVRLKQLFDGLWKDTSFALTQLLDEYRANRGLEDAEFSAALNGILDKLEGGAPLPSPEEIPRESAAAGLQVWHGQALHRLRHAVTRHFLELDACLDAGFAKLRDSVREILSAKARMQNIPELAKLKGAEWWRKMEELWGACAAGEPIREALVSFGDAGLSTRGFLLHRIRACLNVLDSRDPAGVEFAYAPGDNAVAVRDKLDLAWSRACYLVRDRVGGFAKEPPEARFAALEELIDGLVRSEGEDRARDRWEIFCGEFRGDLWPAEFTQLESDTRLRSQWSEHAKALRDAAAHPWPEELN
jgi:hypothetical protein